MDISLVHLSESEIDTLLYVLESYSAHVKMDVARGIRDREKSLELTSDMCSISTKLYKIKTGGRRNSHA